jgi:hypothetical protein
MSVTRLFVGRRGGQRAAYRAGVEGESGICPLGLLKIFSSTARVTCSNSQKMSLNSWLAQGKSWADVPPAIKRKAKTEFKIPSAIHSKLLPEPTTSLATMSITPSRSKSPVDGGVQQ